MRFTLAYALRDVSKHKKRSSVMLTGFVVSTCLISAVFTWVDIGNSIFAEDLFEDRFQVSLSKPPATFMVFALKRTEYEYSIWDTYSSLKEEEMVNTTEPVYRSTCLLNTENKSDSYIWFPEPDNPILMPSVFAANDSFLSFIQDEIELTEGALSMGEDGILMSETLVSEFNKTLGHTVRAGSEVSFALATKIPLLSKDYAELVHWKRVFFKDLVVKGIYKWVSSETLVATVLGPKRLDNSLFMPLSLLNDTVRTAMETDILRAPGPPKLFVQFDAQESVDRGILGLEGEIDRFIVSVKAACEGEMTNVVDKEQITKLVNACSNSQLIALYVLPIISLSILMTIYASEVTFEGRKTETGILRARGFSYPQLYITFVTESLIIALIGSVLGFVLGSLLGSLMPAARGIFEYDPATLQRSLQKNALSLDKFVTSFLSSTIVPILYVVGKAKPYASVDVISTIHSSTREEEKKLALNIGFWNIEFGGSGMPYILFAGVIVAQVAIRWVFSLMATKISAIFVYIVDLTLWFSLSYCLSLVIVEILPNLSGVLSKSTKWSFLSLNFKRHRIFVPVMTFLVFASSIAAFSLVTLESVRDTTRKEVLYKVGCDIRVHTTQDQPVSFLRNLEGNLGPVLDVMPVLYSHGSVEGFYSVRMVGVDAASYREMSLWTPASIVNPAPEQALVSLGETQNGVIVSEYLASALKLALDSPVRIDGHVFVVTGIMRSAPGFGEAHPTHESLKEGLGFQEDMEYVIVNQASLLGDGVNKTSLFFVESGTDLDVKGTLEHLAGISEIDFVCSPQTFDLKKADVYRYSYIQRTCGALATQFVVTMLVGTVILAFSVDYLTSQRTVEYAVMRAVGATQRNIKVLVLVEWAAVILTSLFAGLLVGASYSVWLLEVMPYLFPFKSLVPYTASAPVFSLMVSILLMATALILTSYYSAKRASRGDVGRALRNL